jgi:hypothetical protein
VKEVVSRGNFSVVGKLVVDRLVSKETIKTTPKRWWRLSESFNFKVLGDNLFLIEFEQARDKA